MNDGPTADSRDRVVWEAENRLRAAFARTPHGHIPQAPATLVILPSGLAVTLVHDTETNNLQVYMADWGISGCFVSRPASVHYEQAVKLSVSHLGVQADGQTPRTDRVGPVEDRSPDADARHVVRVDTGGPVSDAGGGVVTDLPPSDVEVRVAAAVGCTLAAISADEWERIGRDIGAIADRHPDALGLDVLARGAMARATNYRSQLTRLAWIPAGVLPSTHQPSDDGDDLHAYTF